MRISLSLVAAASALAASAAAAQVNVAGADTANAWSYAGPTAPEHWTRLGYPDCSAERQSPVDLSADGSRPPLGVSVAYPAWRAADAYNNGHTVVVNARAPGTLSVGGDRYDVVQLHVHVPSEHTIRGHRFAGEAHLVHGAPGRRAVLGTLIVEGAENAAWNPLIRALPGHEGEHVSIDGQVDLVALLGLQDVGAEWIYEYAGSLTTPPCDQDVRWLVRSAPIVLSRAQIEALSSAMVRNARPLQEVGTRPVRVHRGQ